MGPVQSLYQCHPDYGATGQVPLTDHDITLSWRAIKAAMPQWLLVDHAKVSKKRYNISFFLVFDSSITHAHLFEDLLA